MITSAASSEASPSAGPNPGSIRPDSSIGTSTSSPWTRERSKSSAPAPGAMWTIPVPSSSTTSSHGMTRWTIPSCAGASSNGPVYSSPTSSSPLTLRS